LSDITGKVLRERYQIERLLGRGGMADVYLAFDTQRQAHVAIKLIREDLADDADFIRRFSREAAALARLDHPNVVRFYATEQDGMFSFIVMDYVPGSNLQRRLAQAGAPLPMPEVATLFHQIGSALHYAHTMGFIHRDIKPANIMLREDGTALLSDFGAARVAESATLATLTIGTPAYMSPEQILGRDLQPQTDIYSFGIVLYEMLTGRRPFTGDESGLTGTGTISRLRDAHLRLAPPDPRTLNPTIPPALAEVILKTLAKDVDERWPNVLSLVSAWDNAVGVPSRRGKEDAAATAALSASVATVVAPMPTPTGAPRSASFAAATAAATAAGAQSLSSATQAGQAQPPAGGSPPAPVPTQAPKKGSRALWVVAGAVVVLLVLAVVARQFIMPTFAASRTAAPATYAAATAVALAESSRAATIAAEDTTRRESTVQARQTSAVEANSTAQAVSATMTASAAGEATRQVSVGVATGVAVAQVTAQAQQMAAAAVATEQAVAAAAAAATATAGVTPTLQATPTPQPTATTAAPVPTKAPVPGQPSKAPGVVLDFESDLTWRRGNQPYGDLTRATDPVHSGSYSAQLKYDFPAVKDNYVVFQARPPIAIAGQPAALYAWVYGDGSGNMLNAWLSDSTGQVRQYTFGAIKHQSWQQMTAPLDDAAGWPNVHISGPDSGKLSFPARLSALVLDGVPDGAASTGTIYIDDVTTSTQVVGQTPGGSTAAAAPAAAAAAAALTGRIAVPIFANDRRAYDTYVGSIDGSNLQRVNGQASQPTVNANGQRMVYRDWNSGNRSLVAMDTYGGNPRRLTNFLEDGLPSFSPNGQTVVFSSAREPDRKGRIYQVNVDGGPDWQLKLGADPIFGEYPAWLSNGQIAYKGNFPQQGIVVMNADGAAPRLVVGDGSATAPAGSPDSRYIAFMSQRDGNWEVYRVNLDGTGLVRLTNNGANDGLPAWSPDGKSIAFLSDRDGGWAVWAMNADGSNQRRLFSLPGSPDGASDEPSYNSQGWLTERIAWFQ